jgi:DNA-binding response OmpR family regulator
MRKKLLFISDCLDSCPDLIDTLHERFDVQLFCEGAEALLYLRTSPPPDLVIVDPEIEGLADWELVRYLHASKTCRGIPMIVICDRPFEENRHLYYRYGVMDYFRKPFHTSQLIEAIEGLLVADPLERIF